MTALAGSRYGRHDDHPEVVRWGTQRGSICLADQKLPITVPRVRDRIPALRPITEILFLHAYADLEDWDNFSRIAEAAPSRSWPDAVELRGVVMAQARGVGWATKREWLVSREWDALLIAA